jgi:hypothetical protein
VQNVDIQARPPGTLLEFLQWIYKFCSGRRAAQGCNPERRRVANRQLSSFYFGINEAAFKRWRDFALPPSIAHHCT